ncbi:hypothetical protein HER10_EVM0007720 [Colletotrichum scovillei]|uniref:Inorganic pyrophosphatase n=1 Tax=Colletotrichum scovillei TaxID=1209932 RepID=A0A9P7RJD7_9PEZI|nr:uncharacterized protein HER10_EVM0007720 [Colletotrichum scovillei]KAF4779911.1 hypothetical protein HER10_EVM0007720 [Colletotrichum scovillei]KAG7057410.1 inorganic pyrophosphatase [Colletotrichum scovillei]KAG7083089.1 inorganic pyrophosphatase [Colletotrichum scovillei]
MEVSAGGPRDFEVEMGNTQNPVHFGVPPVASHPRVGLSAPESAYMAPVSVIGDASTSNLIQDPTTHQKITRDTKRGARGLPSRKPSPAQHYRHVKTSAKVEKQKSRRWKSKTADSRLSSELDRLLVGDDTSEGSFFGESPTAYKVQHPLRAALQSLPGFSFDDELDSVTFGKHRRVLFGLAEIMEQGGRDTIKVWLEEFLLLAFQTMEKIVARHPQSNDMDDVPMGFIILAREMESTTDKSPASRSFSRARRTMERRLRQSYDLRRLIDWVVDARRKFLGSKPKPMPGLGIFGQAAVEEGTELEKRLWAAIDAQTTDAARYPPCWCVSR